MSDLFSHPIIVTVLDANEFKRGPIRKIKTYAVWPNKVSEKIRNILKSGNNIQKLKKYFKSDPFELPDVPKITNKYKKIGGDAFSLEDIDLMKMEDVEKDDDDFEEDEKIISDTGFVNPPPLTFNKDVIMQNDHYIFPDDNLDTFKKKIQITTGIPTYRQHLWFESNGEVFSPCYELFIEGVVEYINIWKLMDSKTFINEIPVNVNWYSKRDTIKVYNKETSRLLSDIYNDYDNVFWFVIDINDIIQDRKQLSVRINSDIYVRELIYNSFIIKYWPCITNGVFNNFIKNENSLITEYPKLSLKTRHLKNIIDLETKLLKNNYLPSLTKIKNIIFLNNTKIEVINSHFSYGVSINLRNMFDEIVTNNTLVYVACNTDINGKQYNLIKKSTSGFNYLLKPDVGSIIIVITIPDTGDLFLNIFNDGKYYIDATWREDKHVTIDEAYAYAISHVNLVIKKINSMGEHVTIRKLIMMTQSNINISVVGLSFILKNNLTSSMFEGLKDNIQFFNTAGVLSVSSSDNNSITFYLHKGMNWFDNVRFTSITNISNEYDYKTNININQKWESIFIRNKSCIIKNRSEDILINISKIHVKEISSFIRYILLIIQMTKVENKSMVTSVERSISHMKELDPVLYDLKGMYNSKKKYSQICQKTNQPIITNTPSKKSIKYWNFTTNTDQYYECPNAKFPNIYFKTGIHPKNYCIPCCKKMELTDSSKHGHIFNSCMDNHEYVTKSKNVIKSNYITLYGKYLENYRLSHLPELSLGQLFYQQFSSSGKKMDTECLLKHGYYLYGLPQVIGNIQNAGMISIIAFTLSMNIYDFIDETSSLMTKQSSKWSLLLEGTISLYFKSMSEFVSGMKLAFMSNSVNIGFELWNDVFIDIAYLFWNIKIILFVDNGSMISLSISNNLKNIDEYFVPHNKYLFVLRDKDNVYMPIYFINTDNYKNNGDIETKLFKNTDKIISSVSIMIEDSIRKISYNVPPSLESVIDFIDNTDNSSFVINYILINQRNVCYAIVLNDNKEKDSVYFPVEESLHDHIDIKKVTSIYDHDLHTTDVKKIIKLKNEYNVWAEKNKYSQILMSVWILLNNKIVGWKDQYDNYIYHIAPIEIQEAKKIIDVPIIKHIYSTTFINKIIEEDAPSNVNTKVIAKNIYSHYLYQLFVLEFIGYINRSVNLGMRKKINDILKHYEKDRAGSIKSLNNLLVEFPIDYDTILSILSRFNISIDSTNPYEKLIGFKHTNFSYDTVSNIIKNSRFRFDYTDTFKLFSMDEKQLKENIEKIMLEIVEIVDEDPDINTISDSFVSCFSKSQKNEYCKNNKLLIEKNKYKEYLSFLVIDIQNPIKQRIILNPSIKTSINDFKFKINPKENIYINTR